MKKLLCLLVLFQGLFITNPALAQSENESLQPVDERFLEIKEGFIEDCMSQPMPAELSGVRISEQVRTNYCNCWFDYVASNFTYEEYFAIDKAIRENPTSLMNFDQETLNLLANGFEGCYDYAIEANSNIKQNDFSVETIEGLEQQVVSLRHQGRFSEATLMAEQVVEKKSY